MKTIGIKFAETLETPVNREANTKFWAERTLAFSGELIEAARFLMAIDKLKNNYRIYDETGAEISETDPINDELADATNAIKYAKK